MWKNCFINAKYQKILEAVKQNNFSLFKKLITTDSIIDELPNSMKHELIKTVLETPSDAFLELLTDYIDFMSFDANGNSLLITAIYNNQEQKALKLIVSGSPVNLANTAGTTPLIAAAGMNMKTVADEILKKCPSALNQQGPKGVTALMRAAGFGCLDTLDLLIHNGADLNIENEQNRTALFHAVRGGCKQTALSLLTAGANVNSFDIEGQTPLFPALSKNHAEIALLLLEKGAGLNIIDKNGETPLMAAVRGQNTFLVQTLLQKGALASIISNEGKTALSLSREMQNPSITKLLENDLPKKKKETSSYIACWFDKDKNLLTKLRLCDMLFILYHKMTSEDKTRVLKQIQPYLTQSEMQNLMCERSRQ